MIRSIKPNKDISVVNGRLKFTSLNVFGNTIKEMKANPNVNPQEMLKSILGERNYESFKSTMKEAAANVMDTLVDDPTFASVLNDKREVQVDSTVFRITPNGTFIYVPEKENKVDQLATEMLNGKKINETQQEPYLYKVENGIERYATYEEARNNSIEYSGGYGGDSDTGSSGNSGSSGNIKDIETHVISVEQTALGSYLGFSSSYKRYFDSNHRIRFKFSAPNFKLFTYVNIKVKFQKKNGFNIWSKTNCDKIILGWDGLIYDLSDPMPVPQNGNPNSSRINGYNNWAHGYWIPPKLNKKYLVLTIPGFSTKKFTVTSNDLAKMYKAIFDWLKNKLDPAVVKNYNLAIMSNPNEIILGKTEYIEKNVNKIGRTFDFTTAEVGWKGSLDNGSGHPILKLTKTIMIKKASVYGEAYFNNKWLGIRIEKN